MDCRGLSTDCRNESIDWRVLSTDCRNESTDFRDLSADGRGRALISSWDIGGVFCGMPNSRASGFLGSWCDEKVDGAGDEARYAGFNVLANCATE